MKLYLVAALVVALMLMACGSDSTVEEASPLSVLPERAMISFVLNDPAALVRNIDGFIEDGAPLLGVKLLENLICEQLALPSMDSITSRYGVDPSGQVVLWMESAMPTSSGMAVSAPDFPLFISLLEEMGVELTTEESIDGLPVYSMDAEQGKMFFTGTRGVALMAMSSIKLSALVSSLSSETQSAIAPASLNMKFNLSMIGPMAAGQMPMARMLMMQGMAADTTMPAFVPAFMDVYMDGIESLLTQADMLEITIGTDAENFVMKKRISFIPGTELAELLVHSPATDMLDFITMGDVATVRFQMPSEIAFEITKAFTEVFTTELDDEVLEFWSSMASNGAVSIYNDDFIHMTAAYEVNSDVSVEDIAVMYSDYLYLLMPLLEQNAELEGSFSIEDNGIVEIDGTNFYSMSMSILPDSTSSFTFNYWMTVHNGALLLETAPEPAVLLSIIAGDYVPAELTGSGEMAGEMSLAGYLNMVMAMGVGEMDIPEIGSDVIIHWDGGYSDGVVTGEMIMDGSDALATGFAFFGLISAME